MRGGSKKGEHRGNAKPKPEGTPNAVMRNAISKPKKPGKQSTRLKIVEEDIMVAQVIHGIKSAEDMTMKQLMVDNAHYFQNAAYEYQAMAKFMAERMPDTEENRRAIRSYELENERNRRMASDEARNAAPYMHHRLSAIAMHHEMGVGDDIVKQLFDVIDQRNREHPMVIEHFPQKKTA